jgi:hypothetical protein
VAGVVGLAAWPDDPEPEYHGKKLSAWIDSFWPQPIGVITGVGFSNKPRKAEEAVRHIGTNALPYLLKWLNYERPKWRIAVLHACNELPRWLIKDSFRERILGINPDIRRGGIIGHFGYLAPMQLPHARS